jgi:hypothetical protein
MSETPTLNRRKPNRMKRLSAITGAGVVAGLIAASVGGVASAQTVVTEVSEPTSVVQQAGAFVRVATAVQFEDDTEEMQKEFDEISQEDEAVFERFDQCLEDGGVDIESEEEIDENAIDEAVIDAAFEQCEPILDELSDDFDDEFGELFEELSPQDEAIFDHYDQCLEDGGIDALFDSEEIDDAAIDAVFENCDPILDDLSEDAQALFGDCDDDEIHNDTDEDETEEDEAEENDAELDADDDF